MQTTDKREIQYRLFTAGVALEKHKWQYSAEDRRATENNFLSECSHSQRMEFLQKCCDPSIIGYQDDLK
jgi:hypothetical protein